MIPSAFDFVAAFFITSVWADWSCQSLVDPKDGSTAKPAPQHSSLRSYFRFRSPRKTGPVFHPLLFDFFRAVRFDDPIFPFLASALHDAFATPQVAFEIPLLACHAFAAVG